MNNRPEPEDFSRWPIASVDAEEWEIACGVAGCETFLADASWFDVQMAMILNSSDEWAARSALDTMPPLHLRRFRMHALFPPHWSKDEEGVWVLKVAEAIRRKGPNDSGDSFKERYIRGRLRLAELSQEAMPPAKVRCPSCKTLQVIARRVRKGAPSLAPEEKAG
jgi:hypothetical protein